MHNIHCANRLKHATRSSMFTAFLLAVCVHACLPVGTLGRVMSQFDSLLRPTMPPYPRNLLKYTQSTQCMQCAQIHATYQTTRICAMYGILATGGEPVGVPRVHLPQHGRGERLHRVRNVLPWQAQLEAALNTRRLLVCLVDPLCFRVCRAVTSVRSRAACGQCLDVLVVGVQRFPKWQRRRSAMVPCALQGHVSFDAFG